jgi:hypothetical protein
MTATISSIVKENSESNHKFTRVVSTKLSVEDDDFLQRLTTIIYPVGRNKGLSKSELVRLFVTVSLSGIRKELPLLLTQTNKPS